MWHFLGWNENQNESTQSLLAFMFSVPSNAILTDIGISAHWGIEISKQDNLVCSWNILENFLEASIELIHVYW